MGGAAAITRSSYGADGRLRRHQGRRMTAPPVLAAEGVSKRFFENPVLKRVSIEIRPGRIHALPGENYRQFLELWKEKGLKAWATMQPNWLGGFGVYAAVQALSGKDVPAFVEVPLPIITNANLDEYLARAKDFPADGYIYSPYSLEMFDQLIAAAKK